MRSAVARRAITLCAAALVAAGLSGASAAGASASADAAAGAEIAALAGISGGSFESFFGEAAGKERFEFDSLGGYAWTASDKGPALRRAGSYRFDAIGGVPVIILQDAARGEYFQFFVAYESGVLALLGDLSLRGLYAESSAGHLFVPARGYAASSELALTVAGKRKTWPASALGSDSLRDYWAEGGKGPGEGESVAIACDPAAAAGKPAAILVVNGSLFATKAFAESPRPAFLRVAALGGDAVTAELGPRDAIRILPLPAWAGAAVLSLEILGTHPGTKNADCAMNKLIPIYRGD